MLGTPGQFPKSADKLLNAETLRATSRGPTHDSRCEHSAGWSAYSQPSGRSVSVDGMVSGGTAQLLACIERVPSLTASPRLTQQRRDARSNAVMHAATP